MIGWRREGTPRRFVGLGTRVDRHAEDVDVPAPDNEVGML